MGRRGVGRETGERERDEWIAVHELAITTCTSSIRRFESNTHR